MPCEGEVVQRIDIQSERPPFSGAAAKWRAAARAIGLHHATTQPGVIGAFLSLHEGQPCTDHRRLESERVLRAQSFISEAKVTTSHDSLGQLIVVVRTSDEIPAMIGARFHGVRFPEALSLGNGDVGGGGMLVDLNAERAEGYRVGIGGQFSAATTFGHPYRFSVAGERARLGSNLLAAFEHPLFTDIQHVAWHLSYLSDDDFRDVSRQAGDPLALEVTQQRLEASGISRVFGVQTITVVGFGASRIRTVPADSGILITQLGLQPDTGSTLRNRYVPFLATRAGVIAGVRHVRFIPVKGFDALFATQDVASGFMGGLFAAKSLPSLGERDAFLSSAAYVGAVSTQAMAAAAMEVEGRRDGSTNRWDSMIESGRAALYVKSGDALTLILGNEFSGGTRSRLPLQLSLGDMEGGLRGYRGANLGGAQRDVTRIEVRRATPAAVHGADIGAALFAETGTLWAGDAPYGVSTTRESVGFSLLAAYPTRSKRMYRLDVGVPLTRAGTGAGRFEVRVTSADRTDRFWREPDDVSRARTGAVPSSLFSWQSP